MKILFIKPFLCNPQPKDYDDLSPYQKRDLEFSRSKFINFIRPPMSQPLVFLILAVLTPKKYEIEIIDDMIDKIDFNKKYDLVGITLMTLTACRAYEIADEFRRRNIPVVLGGTHVSVLPNEAKQHADSVVIGEAEELWPQLLHDLENGNLKPFYRQKKPVELSLIPHITNYRQNKQGRRQMVVATRGCPYKCEFCAISHNPYGALFRTKPITNVIEEIQSMPQKHLFFGDASLTINPSYTKQLFRKMKELNKKFVALGNIDVLSTKNEFLKLAAEAGCISWIIGLESISQEVIDSIGKKTNKVNEYVDGIKKIHDYGMSVEGAFIFGFDDDNPTVFDDTFDAIQAMELDTAQFNILTPYPGTPIYNRLEKEGRILTKDWSKYDTIFHVVFQPKLMSPEELLLGTQSMLKRFYSPPGILKRIIRSMNIGTYQFISTMIQSYWHYQYFKKVIYPEKLCL